MTTPKLRELLTRGAVILTVLAGSSIVACGSDDAGSTAESPSCPASQTACTHDGVITCATLSRDPSNCGACGKTCAPGEVCAEGVCTFRCPEGFTECDGACRNLDDDPDACGSCATKCASVNATPACKAKTCAFVCNAGFGDCDGQADNGCEKDLSNDRTNCGACGTICPNMCIAGSCAAKAPPEGTFVKTHENCTHLPPHRNEDVAADWGGVLYAAASCAGGEIEVAASTDGGATWTVPVTVPGFTNIAHLELRGGAAAGILHVVGATADGDLVYSRSTDAGATFLATPVTIRTGGTSDTSTVVYEGKIFVLAPNNAVGFPAYVSVDGGDTWSLNPFTSPTTGNATGRAAATISSDGVVVIGASIGGSSFRTQRLVGSNESSHGASPIPPGFTNPAVAVSMRPVFGGDGATLRLLDGDQTEMLPAPVAVARTRQIVPGRSPGVVFVSGQTGASETSLHRLTIVPTIVLGAAKTLSGTNAHVAAYDDTRAVVSMQVGSDIVTGVVTP